MIPRQARSQAWRSRIEILHKWSGPMELWLAMRIGSWAMVLPFLVMFMPLPSLARLMWTSTTRANGDPGRPERIIEFINWIYRSRRLTTRNRCLERGLLLYRYLSRYNRDPRLIVGFRKDGKDLLGHAWVTTDGRPIDETPIALDGFSTVLVFGPRGSVQVPSA